MAYKVWQTGDQVQGELDDVEFKIDVATQAKNGYLSKDDKKKIDDMAERPMYDYEIDNIWNSIII